MKYINQIKQFKLKQYSQWQCCYSIPLVLIHQVQNLNNKFTCRQKFAILITRSRVTKTVQNAWI